MPRNYVKIEKDIAVDGFFSDYLPDCFSICQRTLSYPPPKNCDFIPPFRFTMSRFNNNDARRDIYIPEIGSYIVLREYIKNNGILEEIIPFTEDDTHSFSPILNKKDDSVMKHEQSYGTVSRTLDDDVSNYIENTGDKLIKAAGAKKILKLDIANCYASFYTHYIPTILLGYEKTETEYLKFCLDHDDTSIDPQYHKYRTLDLITRHQNQNRTNGLLVGTQYSKIIAEAILVRIDIELSNSGVHFSRYSDDYEVYIYNNEEKQVISKFQRILKRYGFTLNNEKTEIVEFPYYVVENLKKLFGDNLKDSLNTEDLIKLFNTFMVLESNGTKGAIRYLIKSIELKPLNTSNMEAYKAYLLTIIANNERSLSKACSILIKNKNTLALNPSDVELIKKMLDEHLQANQDLEAIWLVYMLIETNKYNREITDNLISKGNELISVMLLRKGLLLPAQITSVIQTATSWILLYELFSLEYLSENDFIAKLNLNKNIAMYRQLKNNSLHFCTL